MVNVRREAEDLDPDDAGSDDQGGDEDDRAEGEEADGDDEDADVDDPLAHLPAYVLERVEKLRELDTKCETISEQYVAERAEFEKKFAALYGAVYSERTAIVRGDNDDSAAGAPPPEQGGEPPVKGIPHFWVTAMSHHDEVAEWITEQDVDCLESLEDIVCEDKDDGKGFELHFHFAPNDYFENTVLTKSYDVPNLLLSDEPMLKGVKGTSIRWKPGRSLTFRMIKKKQRGKGKHAGQIRTVQKKEELESFFKWFEPPDMPPMDSMDEEKAEELEAIFDEDYELAMAFRTQIIPRAVMWFTGEVRWLFSCFVVVWTRASSVHSCFFFLQALEEAGDEDGDGIEEGDEDEEDEE
jgi:nucleosome assembly protein 1-like 1